VGNLNDTLSERVHELIHSRQSPPILSTTGTQSAVYLLAARTEVLEEAVRELAATVEELRESQQSSGTVYPL
jgi:hypothetical protein